MKPPFGSYFLFVLTAASLGAQALNWSPRDHGLRPNSSFGDGVFGGGKFVVVTRSVLPGPPARVESEVASSPDGVAWTVDRLPAGVIGNGIAYGNRLYALACGVYRDNESGSVFTSPDGIAWTLRHFGGGPLISITSSGTHWVAAGPRVNGTNAVVSADGVNWTRISIGRGAEEVDGVAALPGTGIFIAWTVQRSDLIWVANPVVGLGSWAQVPIFNPPRPTGSPPGWIAGVTTVAGKFVAIFQEFAGLGYRARILTSTNGLNWTVGSDFPLPANFLSAQNHSLALSADPASGRATLAFAGSIVSVVGDEISFNPRLESSAGRFTSSISYSFGRGPFDFVVYGDGQFLTGQYDSKILSAPVAGGDYAPPAIFAGPADQTAILGGAVTFGVSAGGGALTYQWLFNNAAVPGATGASYALTPVSAANAGSYSVRVTNPGGTVTSGAATLTIGAAPPVITGQPRAQTVNSGGRVDFAVTATGAGLGYQWFFNNTAVNGATDATYTIGAATVAEAGAYSVRVVNSGGVVTSEPASLTVVPLIAYLGNLSVRARAGGGETLIVGVIVGGGAAGAAKTALIRGVGPTLTGFGVPGALADPVLSVLSGSTIVASNDDWNNDAAVAAASSAVGAFPLVPNSRDAALVGVGLGPGGYTVQLSGKAGASGNALIELYDTAAPATITAANARFTNVSARTFGGIGADTLIVGFSVAGVGTRRLVIRAIGPGLTAFGVVGAMPDPKLELYAGAAKAGENDNWDVSTLAAQQSVGAFALASGSRDAVLVTTLAPGSYTVQVTGGTTGVALVEVYEAP